MSQSGNQPKVLIAFYSRSGVTEALANAVAEGTRAAGAEVRLRRVAELAPAEAIASNPAWQSHVDATHGEVPEASIEDLDWADGYALGTPTRFGNPTSQLKQFIDQAGPLWAQGKLADKAATTFTSAMNAHGGSESTILAVNNVFYHWGAVIVAPGYTDQQLFAAGGNPYGTSYASGQSGDPISAEALTAARIQGRRLATVASKLATREDQDSVPAEEAAAYTS